MRTPHVRPGRVRHLWTCAPAAEWDTPRSDASGARLVPSRSAVASTCVRNESDIRRCARPLRSETLRGPKPAERFTISFQSPIELCDGDKEFLVLPVDKLQS